MIGFDPVLDAPTTARYHREAIEQITQCVEERVYCGLLGPRLCGKTLLLRFIEQNLAHLLGWSCVYIDLHQIRATTQKVFFADLIRLTAEHLTAGGAGNWQTCGRIVCGVGRPAHKVLLHRAYFFRAARIACTNLSGTSGGIASSSHFRQAALPTSTHRL